MDFLQQLFSTGSAVDTVSVIEMVGAALVSFFLALIIGYTYRVTHQGPSYSQSTVQTMVIMAVVVSLIMLIIGTNIARAFTLVGALSIIRFRNAVKDSRDLAFYFLAMAVGMAAGTHNMAIAAIFTLVICSMIYFLYRFGIGAKPTFEILLRLTVDDSVDYQTAFDEVFYKHLSQSDLLSVDGDGSGQQELVYSIALRKGDAEQSLLADLRQVDPTLRAQLIHGHSNVNL
ncbi:MAG: DUF4956 domain-containing protein [Thermoanaerobaculia bacterium]